MLKERKIELVDELAKRLEEADTLIVADYRGLSVAELQELRGELYAHGAKFTVVKNTLTLRAAEKAGVDELLSDFLSGPTAIAFITDGDMVATAKALVNTSKETEVLSLKGGVLDGRRIEAEDITQLAKLPPIDVLQGSVVGVIAAPLTHLVSLFAAPLRDMVGVLDARQRKLEEAGESPAPAEVEDSPAEEASAPQETEDGEAEAAPTDEVTGPAAEAETTDDSGDAEAASESDDTDASEGKEDTDNGDN